MKDSDEGKSKPKDESRSIGGKARAAALTDEKRTAIAKKAAAARWGQKPAQATHKGNFQADFGFDVDCYVLNDEKKTAVITQTGMGQAIGLAARGHSIHKFANGRGMAEFIGADVLEKLQNPLKFQYRPSGTENLVVVANGYDVTLLIDICKAIIAAQASGKMSDRQAPIARQAHVIMGASAKSGIQGLVYSLAGYNATREEVVAAFKMFVQEEAREYEREFPEQLYEEWYRLYELPRPERNRPWKFRHLTITQVYAPLAKSSGKVFKLTKEQREKANDPWKKLHQFLSDIGVKALRTQLGQLLGIARISRSREEYEGHFRTLFNEQLELFEPPKSQ